MYQWKNFEVFLEFSSARFSQFSRPSSSATSPCGRVGAVFSGPVFEPPEKAGKEGKNECEQRTATSNLACNRDENKFNLQTC